MQHAMGELYEKPNLFEKQPVSNLDGSDMQQYDPDKYIFKVRCAKNESPYGLFLLLNNTKKSHIESNDQEHTVVVGPLNNDDDIHSVGVYKNNEIIATKNLKDFLSFRNEPRSYEDLPYGSFSEIEWDVDKQRMANQLRNVDSKDSRAEIAFRLHQDNNTIDLVADIQEYLDYDYEKISFFALHLHSSIPYEKTCFIPLEPRKKTFLERHWHHRMEAEEKGFSFGLCAPISAPFAVILATVTVPYLVNRAIKNPIEFLKDARQKMQQIKKPAWPFFLGFLQGTPLGLGALCLIARMSIEPKV